MKNTNRGVLFLEKLQASVAVTYTINYFLFFFYQSLGVKAHFLYIYLDVVQSVVEYIRILNYWYGTVYLAYFRNWLFIFFSYIYFVFSYIPRYLFIWFH